MNFSFAFTLLVFIACASVASGDSVQRQKRKACGSHEKYLKCGPNCETECKTLNKPCLVRHIRCPDGCFCVKGYARDRHDRCIPIKKCRKDN